MRRRKPQPRRANRRDALVRRRPVVAPILAFGSNGMRPIDHHELMVKWISAALVVGLVRLVRVAAPRFPIHRMHPMARGRMHPNGDRRCAPMTPGVNPVLSMERPDNAEGLSLGVVARALRRLLFATWILLGLAFAVVCYAEMLGVVQFD